LKDLKGALRRAKRGKAATNRSSVSKAGGRLRPKGEAPNPPRHANLFRAVFDHNVKRQRNNL